MLLARKKHDSQNIIHTLIWTFFYINKEIEAHQRPSENSSEGSSCEIVLRPFFEKIKKIKINQKKSKSIKINQKNILAIFHMSFEYIFKNRTDSNRLEQIFDDGWSEILLSVFDFFWFFLIFWFFLNLSDFLIFVLWFIAQKIAKK